MENNIEIVKADFNSISGGKLNMMALQDITKTLVGSIDNKIIEQTMIKMWHEKNNRFSHEYAYEAKVGNQTMGIITCYPVSLLNKLAFPTLNKLLKTRKLSLIAHTMRYPKNAYSLLNLDEGRLDEYHIGSIAALPESRGMGVGTKMLKYAEELAIKNSYNKISLTVKQTNSKARKLYEHLGYQVVDKIDKDPFHLFRMVKHLSK